jgi:protein arginine kinase activator
MKCEQCNQLDATVRIIEIVGDQKKSSYACETCAGLSNMIDPERLLTESGLAKIIAEVAAILPTNLDVKEKITCPTCSITWEQVKSASRLGCPDDYVSFKAQLDNLFRDIHGSTQHLGRGPVKLMQAIKRRREEERLKRELDEAVRNEDFEKAAHLRDLLRNADARGSGPVEHS